MDSRARYPHLATEDASIPSRSLGQGCSQLQSLKVGFPIRRSPDQSLFAAPRGLSQRTTSFIASQRQGIHQMPFSHLIALILKNQRVKDARPHRSPSAEVTLRNKASIGPDPLRPVFRHDLFFFGPAANTRRGGQGPLDQSNHETCP
jgi:hypothetical protein